MKDHEPFMPYRQEFRSVRFTPTPFEDINVSRLLGVYPDQRDLLVSQAEVGYGHGDWRKLQDLYGPIELTGGGRDTPVGMLEVGLDLCEPLSEWAPTTSEVGTIINLARAVAPHKEKPLVLDMECGTGLLAYALGDTGLVEVVGSEQEETWLKANKSYFKHPFVSFLNESAWEVARRFSPSYNPRETERRMKLVDEVHSAIELCGEVFEEKAPSRHFDEEWGKWVNGFHEKLAELRRLSAGFIRESDVDLVINSCAPTGFDPTIPIRDIIHPKVIFYVGETDFYQPSATGVTAVDIPRVELTGESYKPGRQYQEIADWRTYCREDWKWFHFPSNDIKDELYLEGLLRVGVSVQKRKDVQLSPVDPIQIGPLPWEEELMLIRHSPAPVTKFLQQIGL